MMKLGPALPEEPLKRMVTPVNLANEQLLPVPDAFSGLFPLGGMQRGWSVGFSGQGGWSVALALLGSAVARDGWAACVGLEELGLVAGDELGLRLDRLLMVESPGPDELASVVASLVEVVDVVCLGQTRSIGIRDGRRLMARAREQDAVLFHLDGGRSWPHPLDVNLEAGNGRWFGIGEGHGRLVTRSLSVTASGRRSMAKPRSVDLLLPGPEGLAVAIPPQTVPASTSPAGPKEGGVAWPVSA